MNGWKNLYQLVQGYNYKSQRELGLHFLTLLCSEGEGRAQTEAAHD